MADLTTKEATATIIASKQQVMEGKPGMVTSTRFVAGPPKAELLEQTSRTGETAKELMAILNDQESVTDGKEYPDVTQARSKANNAKRALAKQGTESHTRVRGSNGKYTWAIYLGE